MSEMLKKMVEARQNAWSKAQEINERNLTGALSAEDQASYDKAMEDVRSLKVRIDTIQAEERSAAAAEAAMGGKGKAVESRGKSALAEAVRSLGIGQGAEVRALVKSDPASAGDTVGQTFDQTLYRHMILETNASLFGTFSTPKGEDWVKRRTTGYATFSLVAEQAVIGQSDPTYDTLTLRAYKAGFRVILSHEMVNDSDFNLESEIASQAGPAFANFIGEYAIANGTGVNQPRALLADALLGATSDTAGALTFDDLSTLKYSLIAPYRRNAKWLINDLSVGEISRLKDNTDQYLWQPSRVAGEPDTILGHAVETDHHMPLIGTGNKAVVFGDLSKHLVRLVEGVRVERSVDSRFDSDEIEVRVLARVDSALLDANAVKYAVIS